jgi:hypothetical protein
MAETTEKTAAQLEWDRKKLGAMWKRVPKSGGAPYLTGTINLKNLPGFPDKDVQFVAFSNKSKTKDTHPDLQIYISEPKGGGAGAPAAKPVAKAAAKSAPIPAATPVEDDGLI